MGLMHLGRARLAMALPGCRQQLRSTKSQDLYELFEAYAVASTAHDHLMHEAPRQEDLVSELQQICRDLQIDVVALLALLEELQSQKL
ncbi:hypothetical protein AB4Z34_14635 [Ensifer sp. 2YAB10]|jgi:hypothetical protein|uniref:hypothetical protein n=1 Tax=unclassified Ensifer TaxID=2633371 RepID=UPI001A509F35|nr:hypothetical protein [Ensifer sp. SSB1]MBK5566243.1 hypothetical protein [Ensifer sp. SSB1]